MVENMYSIDKWLQRNSFKDRYRFYTDSEDLVPLAKVQQALDENMIEYTENINKNYADVDQFICKECGIHLREWSCYKIDEDNGEEYSYEYSFNYCPNCGRKIRK